MAVVLDDGHGRVLVQERPPSKPAAGFWEFPGGKVDGGETPEVALERELREELGVDLAEAPRWEPVLPIRPEGGARGSRLLWGRVGRWRGEPVAREGQTFAWLKPVELLRIPLLAADLPIVARLLLPPRLAITPPAGGTPERLEERLETLLDEGFGGVLARFPALDPESRQTLSARLREVCARRGGICLVHEQEDLARRIGAEGVHHPAASLPRRRLPSDAGLLHGVSVHDRPELERALRLGAHYLLLGPVCPTASHPDRPPLGWEAFAALTALAPVPVYALGGLGRDDLERARGAGAHGIALLSGCDWN